MAYGAELEWREAARFAGVAWEHFCTLDGDEQSAIVAHHRVHSQIEAVIAHEQARERRLKGRRGR